MSFPRTLDDRLEAFAGEVDLWTRQFFASNRPNDDRFAALLSYPLGWVDPELRPLERTVASGKRLRPALCLLVCEAVCGDYRPALAAAAAVELVHNFSLVHDDIQDESPLRRGRPTVWAKWDTAQAINVGDSLFALAQLAMLHDERTEPQVQIEAARRLNVTCLRLVEGQFLDLELQAGGSATFEAYQAMVGGKTAALLECAAWLGARCGGTPRAGADSFGEFGRRLGMAFQFQDDLLGLWGDPRQTGKSAESDLLTRKQALPAVLALRRSGPAADRFRTIFLGPGEMRASEAGEALELLDELQVREETAAMVNSGYDAAAAALGVALGARANSELWLLLERFRDRAD
jgi:geranylgeranyl diphosphate synthase, type I